MGPSIDELKTVASSRVESILSPSSSAVLRPSASGINLNLPRESIRTKINASNLKPSTDSGNLPVTGPSLISTQENLRATAQTINGLIQKDKIQPDLGELLNGTS